MLSPPGEGRLGPSLCRGFELAGHEARLVPTGALTGGRRVVIKARAAGFDAPLARALALPVIERVRRLRAELVVVVKGRFLDARDVDRLRRVTGAAVVCLVPDDPLHPPFREEPWLANLRRCDRVFIWSDGLAERLADCGIRSATLPFAYDPELYGPPATPGAREYDVAFVGQWSEHRERHVRALAGLRLAVSGPGWAPRLRSAGLADAVVGGGEVFGRRASALYGASAIGLNLLHPQNTGTHNMRTWELPATMTAMVATDSAEHRRLFGTDGAGYFSDPDELRAVVDRLLTDPAALQRAASTGRAAVADGTYERRALELVAALEHG